MYGLASRAELAVVVLQAIPSGNSDAMAHACLYCYIPDAWYLVRLLMYSGNTLYSYVLVLGTNARMTAQFLRHDVPA